MWTLTKKINVKIKCNIALMAYLTFSLGNYTELPANVPIPVAVPSNP